MTIVSKAFTRARYARQLRAPLQKLASSFPSNTTIDQFSVLYAIHEASTSPEKPELAQIDLCKLTAIDRSTMADVLQRLSQRGWIVVRRSTKDRRRNVPVITRSGRNILDKCLKAEQEFILSGNTI